MIWRSGKTNLSVYHNNCETQKSVVVKDRDSEARLGECESNRIWLWQNRDSVSFLAIYVSSWPLCTSVSSSVKGGNNNLFYEVCCED